MAKANELNDQINARQQNPAPSAPPQPQSPPPQQYPVEQSPMPQQYPVQYPPQQIPPQQYTPAQQYTVQQYSPQQPPMQQYTPQQYPFVKAVYQPQGPPSTITAQPISPSIGSPQNAGKNDPPRAPPADNQDNDWKSMFNNWKSMLKYICLVMFFTGVGGFMLKKFAILGFESHVLNNTDKTLDIFNNQAVDGTCKYLPFDSADKITCDYSPKKISCKKSRTSVKNCKADDLLVYPPQMLCTCPMQINFKAVDSAAKSIDHYLQYRIKADPPSNVATVPAKSISAQTAQDDYNLDVASVCAQDEGKCTRFHYSSCNWGPNCCDADLPGHPVQITLGQFCAKDKEVDEVYGSCLLNRESTFDCALDETENVVYGTDIATMKEWYTYHESATDILFPVSGIVAALCAIITLCLVRRAVRRHAQLRWVFCPCCGLLCSYTRR